MTLTNHAAFVRRSRLALVAGIGCWLTACGSPPVPEAPAPHRPEPVVAETQTEEIPDDCQPAATASLPEPVPYAQRSIAESKNLADRGFQLLKQSEDRERPEPERQQLMVDAVDQFLISLTADPYNVHATYNLAAAYARIDRDQCAVNLLARLVELHGLPSQRGAVEEKLDRLLGRGRYRNNMDPDFDRLRGQRNFRDIVAKFPQK